MFSFLTGPGFLGTHARFISDLTLVLIILSSSMFNIGFYLVRRKHIQAHRWVQMAAAGINAIVVIVVMIYSFIKHILPGIPAKLLEGSYGITTFHAFVGSMGLLLGIFVVLRGNELVPQILKFKKYKPFMRTSYALYMAATLVGVILYVVVFVYGI